MIDLHCHLLPGVDDGPATMEDALDLARAHVEAGTTTVVATPHVSWEYPGNTAETLAEPLAALRAEVDAAGIPLEVLAGGEVALTRAVEMTDEELAALRIGTDGWLLVECPFTPGAAGVEGVLIGLQERGHRILIAHPERSPAFRQDRDLLARLVERGMRSSITAGALAGRFGRPVEKLAVDFVRRDLAHSVASDAHDLARRPPGIAPVLAEAGMDDALAGWLGRDVPAAILRGDPLPPRPEPPRPRGLLDRLRRAS